MDTDTDREQTEAPFNAVPWTVWLLAVPIAAAELLFQAGAHGLAGGPQAIGWRAQAINRLAFVPELLHETLASGRFLDETLLRLLAYPLVHVSLLNTVFAVVILVAVGKAVGDALGAWALLAVFFAGSLVGALAYAAVPEAKYALIGAFPGVYGLIGAYTILQLHLLRMFGKNPAPAFRLIGFLVTYQVLLGLAFGANWGELVAELAGFAAGFVMGQFLISGGFAGALARLRRR